MYSDQEDTGRTAREQLEIWADYTNRFLEDRQQVDDTRIVDLLFDDFVADPMAAVEDIYARFGWALGDEDRTRMKDFLHRERRGRHGEHEYDLNEMGISAVEISRHYASYLDFLAEFGNSCLRTRGATAPNVATGSALA